MRKIEIAHRMHQEAGIPEPQVAIWIEFFSYSKPASPNLARL
jgi:hypothetical protein